MAEPIQNTLSDQDHEILPVEPFRSLNPHFGMLMGVDDFQLLQSYARGKVWLHNAWLHGAGTVWGLALTVEESGRLIVSPGLALDALGRELYLSVPACLDLAAWFRKQEKMLRDGGHLSAVANGGLSFPAHVVIRFRACLDRQVPALREPCEGDSAETAYSRVNETVELLLLPGPYEEPKDGGGPEAYHRLRALFALEGADETDADLMDAIQSVAKLPEAERPAARLAALRRLAALDSAGLAPPGEDPGAPYPLFPSAEDAPAIPLGNLIGVRMAADGEDGSFSGLDGLDPTIRPVILPTRLIQELLCGPPCQCGPEAVMTGDAGGPRVRPDTVGVAGNELSFRVHKPLSAKSVNPEGIRVLSYKNNLGWREVPVTGTDYNVSTREVKAQFDTPLVGNLVRILVKGTGPHPLIGTDEIPLAGALGGAPSGATDGRDFVHMFKRSGP